MHKKVLPNHVLENLRLPLNFVTGSETCHRASGSFGSMPATQTVSRRAARLLPTGWSYQAGKTPALIFPNLFTIGSALARIGSGSWSWMMWMMPAFSSTHGELDPKKFSEVSLRIPTQES